MATDFGFIPDCTAEHYFISYNTEDSLRVAPIARALHAMGMPVWYDYGLAYGKEWERQIARYIHSAKAVILFITNGVFSKERSYVRREYEIAELRGIRIIPVLLDSIDPRRLPDHSVNWWLDIRAMHSVVITGEDNAGSAAKKIAAALGMHSAHTAAVRRSGTAAESIRAPKKAKTQENGSKKRKIFGICALVCSILFGILSWYFALRDWGYDLPFCIILSSIGSIFGIAAMIAGRSKKVACAGIIICLSSIGLAFLLDHIYWSCL